MTMGQTNMSVAHQVAFGPLGGGDVAHGIYCEQFGLQEIPTHAEDNGFYGTRWKRSEGVVEDKITCSGPIVFRPRADNLTYLLPAILGQATFSNAGQTLGTNVQGFKIGHHCKLNMHTFVDCKFDVATFSSSKADTILKLTLATEALSMTRGNISGWPSGITYSTDRPFVHSGTTLLIDSDTFNPEDIAVAISRSLVKDEHLNSKTRLDLPEGDWIVTVTMTSPFNTSTDAALLALRDASATMSLKYTNGDKDLTFAFPALQSPIKSPTVQGKAPVRHNAIQWEARSLDGDSITGPVKVTLADAA